MSKYSFNPFTFRTLHKLMSFGEMKSASVENPIKVMVVGATTQVGSDILQELVHGEFKRFIHATAAVQDDDASVHLEKVIKKC